mgnify:CR=1 FL=1|jgi:hypothetical protein
MVIHDWFMDVCFLINPRLDMLSVIGLRGVFCSEAIWIDLGLEDI